MRQIKSQEELDALIDERSEQGETLDCFVQLNYFLRSSKCITWAESGNGNDYDVVNLIDDSNETILHDKLMQSFPIGEAIKAGALYAY